jgi:5'-nucleotidase
LTLETPLRVERVDDNLYYVNGTPTDCVHIAITGLLEHEPDVLISGECITPQS